MAAIVAPATLAAAAGATQDRLCDGAPSGCKISASPDPVLLGWPLTATVQGKANGSFRVQFYVIQFNSAGAITGLVPLGSARDGTTDSRATPSASVALDLGSDLSTEGGWGFVGLVDDDSLDLTTRLGAVIGFGNNAPHLLGDGYAYQKPVATELDLQVVGNKRAGYWVEYQDDRGKWVALPGQGYDDQIYLRNSPGEVGHIAYTVPDTLTRGKPYTFRLNTSLNYSGSTLITKAGFSEWTVVPSDSPKKQGRGKNFDPTLPAGHADQPDPVPSYSPTPTSTATPTPTPSGEGTPRPSSGPGAATSSATTATTAGSPTAGSSQTPTTTASSAQAGGAASPSAAASRSADPAVWGKEATAAPAWLSESRPAGTTVAIIAGIVVAMLMAAPLAWWAWSRYRLTRRPIEDLP